MKYMSIEKSQKLLKVFLTTFVLSIFTILFGIDGALAQSYDMHTTALIEGAKKEGKVVWYAIATLQDALDLKIGFEKKYPPIKVEVYRLNDASNLTRILSESQANKHIFDVGGAGPIEFETMRRKGIFAKYLSPQRKFFTEIDKDQEGFWTGIYSNKHTMTYNTKLVAPNEVPKTYEDLLNPRWKGKMGITTNDYYWFAVMMRGMGEEKGLQYMKRLGEQNLSFRTGRTLTTQLCAAGEFSIGIATYARAVEEMKSKGAHVEWIALEPVVSRTLATGISAHATHPNAARLFIDFLLSGEGQQIIASAYRTPTRIDVEALIPRLKCADKKTYPPDFSIADDFDKYIRLFREVLMRKK